MRSLTFSLLAVALSACAGAQLRTELVAQGSAPVMPHAPSPPIELTTGTYDIALRFNVPRAQQVRWAVRCGEHVQGGVAGESFESYRARRLSEIAASQRQVNSITRAATNTVAGVAVNAPGVRGQAQVTVTEAPPPTELPYGDVGAGVFMHHARFSAVQNGPCAVEIEAEDPSVAATFDLTRQVDLKVEAAIAKIEADNRAAREARGMRVALVGQLTAVGADPEGLAKARAARAAELAEQARIAAEAQAERERIAAAEAAVRAESQAKIDAEQAKLDQIAAADRHARLADERQKYAEQQKKQAAIDAAARAELLIEIERERRLKMELEIRITRSVRETRSYLVGYLAGVCGADAGRYARLQAEEQLRIEMRMRMSMEESERVRMRLELEQRRQAQLDAERAAQSRLLLQASLAARGNLLSYLASIGARQRPDRPMARVESRGAAPFDGAVWVEGDWTFHEASWSWTWTAGGWIDGDRAFGNAGGVARDSRPVSTTTTVVVETPPPPPEPAVIVAEPVPASTTVTVEPAAPTIRVDIPAVRVPVIRVDVNGGKRKPRVIRR